MAYIGSFCIYKIEIERMIGTNVYESEIVGRGRKVLFTKGSEGGNAVWII